MSRVSTRQMLREQRETLRRKIEKECAVPTSLIGTLTAADPNTLGALLIVNPPTVLRVFWNLLAPLFDPRTLAKVRVLASTEDEATQAWIVALFGKENVPPEWGGTHAGGGTLTNAFPAPEVDPDELKKLCSTDVVSDRSGSLYVVLRRIPAISKNLNPTNLVSLSSTKTHPLNPILLAQLCQSRQDRSSRALHREGGCRL